jgi:hypothetical protein
MSSLQSLKKKKEEEEEEEKWVYCTGFNHIKSCISH